MNKILPWAFCIVLCVCFTSAWSSEIIPVSVWTSAETTQGHEINKLIDGDLTTYAELLDDSRTGKGEKTVPPNGISPVTSTFVLDLGRAGPVRGIRLTAQKSLAAKMASSLSIFTCNDPEGKTNVRFLKEKQPLPAVIVCYSVFVTWEPVETRYVGVRIDESFERPNNFPTMPRNMWFQPAYRSLLQEQGYDNSGSGRLFLTDIAEVSCFNGTPTDMELENLPTLALPLERLHRDWIYQDYGLDITKVFYSKTDANIEKAMIGKVVGELAPAQHDATVFQNELQKLSDERIPGNDIRWKDLYFKACETRRQLRLQYLLGKTKQIIYTKHTTLGGGTMHAGTENLTDTQYDEHNLDWRPGAKLCLMTLHEDGTVANEVLLETQDGFIRDPNLSFDGKTLAFSMRKNHKDDDFHIYMMDMATRKITQITFSAVVDGKTLPCGDTEPCFTPGGKIIFQSTRCEQLIPCWKSLISNLYMCNAEGKNLYRVGFDQVNTYYPQVLEDGRIIFTRWEYNDRNSSFQQPLFAMNSDGTAQTEYYGNNSYQYPVSFFHARGIPGSSKVIAVTSGHYALHKGKLVLVDRRKGTQGDAGIEYVAGSSPDGKSGRQPSRINGDKVSRLTRVFFGQFGPQYQYPFAFDEERYLVGYLPEGSPTAKGPYHPGFGIYFMTIDGERELLAFDPTISCSQAIPFVPRNVPPICSSLIDRRQSFGRFYVQNVYIGPGLKDIPVGTIKKLRVVALEYRPCLIGDECCTNTQKDPRYSKYNDINGSSVHVPISLGGSWDVKHVLGEVDVGPDGSCFFEVPANNPVYFQLLDEKGRCVQTMRSWTLLLPGERRACIGCHENKNQAGRIAQNVYTIAMAKPIQKLQPIPGTQLHPLLERLQKEELYANVNNYFGVNQPRLFDEKIRMEGFSYPQQIQPILDKHCVKCHMGDVNNPDKIKASSLRLTGEPIPEQTDSRTGGKYFREFSQSYRNLINSGVQIPLLNWYSSCGISEMIPPCALGSTQSKLMDYLEPSHYDVQLTDGEKRTIACWIDLAVPYCGSYYEANTWNDDQKKTFQYHQNKRKVYAAMELEEYRRKTGVCAGQTFHSE